MNNKMQKPPRTAEWIIKRLSLYNDKHSINGDIEELYTETLNEKGRAAAFLWYWFQTLLTVFQYIKLSIYWSLVMFKNYLKITFKTLLKYKTFSVINISGLGLSMAVCLMIIIYVKDQKNSDMFHEHKDRIFRVYTTDKNIRHSEVKGWATSPGTLAPYLKDNYSFIENIVRIRRMWSGSILNTGTAITISGLYVEPSFLNIFTYPLKYGDPESALKSPFNSIYFIQF